MEDSENPDGLAAAKVLLKTDPSADSWEIELRRVLRGERESDLLRLGSVDEYVDKILDLSVDRPVAEQSFQKALRRVVRTWQPENPESKEYFACLLDLIGAYTPDSPYAIPKVLYFLDCLSRYGERLKSSSGYEAHSDLYRKALVVLEKYFPRALNHADGEFLDFKAYVSVLEKNLASQLYGGYAAARLIDLRVVEPKDQTIGSLIRENPDSQREIISLLFASERQVWLSRDLKHIIEHALNAGDEAVIVFEQVLRVFGGKLELKGQGAAVSFDHHAPMFVNLSSEAMVKYATFTQRRKMNLDRLAGLLTAAKEQAQAQAEIAEILELCLTYGSGAARFKQELSKFGAEVLYVNGVLKLYLHDRSCHRLQTSKETAFKYYMIWSIDERPEEEIKNEIREIINVKRAEAARAAAA
jgi:hypothetical protein